MLKKLNSLFKYLSWHSLPILTIFLLCVVIIFSWFHYGFLYGGGDVGLPTYDPIRLLGVVKNIWWDVHAPGFAYPSALTSIPLYAALIPLQVLGFSNLAIQATVFGTLLFLMGVGMYFLFFEVESSKSKVLALIAGVYYMLNPYMISQVWHRFVHTAFFLGAVLPILTFIYIRLIKTRHPFWFLGYLFTSFVFTYTFGSLPYMVVIWIPIVLYTAWKCIESRNLKSCIEIAKMFILLFLAWVVLNIWWLYPFWTTGPAIFSEIHSLYSSVSTLTSLSSQSTIPMVLRGINPFYVFGDGAWVNGYNLIFMQLVSWTFPLVILMGIYSIIVRKRNNFYVWIALFFIGVFISKGTAAPFGYPLLWLFSKSFLLGAFRNPFEKLGILVPFATAFIFPLGISAIYSQFRKYLAIIIIATLLVLEFIIYPWPVWLGKMFGTYDNPAFVQVPTSYGDADAWINNQRKDGRVLHLPFAPGDAITYNWEKGYSGIDPSQLLFAAPSISHGFGLEFLDKSLSSINAALLNSTENQKLIADVLSSLNVRYIVLHKDVDWKTRVLIDPELLEQNLAKIGFVNKKISFGDLVIYEISDDKFTPVSFTTRVTEALTGGYKYFGHWPEVYQNDDDKTVFITPVNGNKGESVQGNLRYSAVPTEEIDVPFFPLAYKENALAELPQPRFLPGSIFYPLILVKERMSIFASPVLNLHNSLLDFSGKRLAEAYLLTKNGNTKLANNAKENYLQEINSALDVVGENQKADLIDDAEMLILKRIFTRHEIILEELGDKSNLENLKTRLSKMGFIPYFELKEELGMSKYGRKIYRFDIKKKDNYEILLRGERNQLLYEDNLRSIALQIDNDVIVRSTNQAGEFMSLGRIALDEGLHEISYGMNDSINLVPEPGSFETTGKVKIDNTGGDYSFTFSTTKQDSSTLSFPITGFDSNSIYRIDFDFWIQYGQGPILQFEQDSDWDLKEERFMDVNKLFDKGNYSFFWNSASEPLRPRQNTKNALVRIVVEPWNNCLEILRNENVCINSLFRRPFNRESSVIIKNISVKRPFTDEIFLHPAISNAQPTHIAKVALNQISPSLYEGELKIDQPVLFSLLTTFHPEWKLYLTKDGKTEVVPEANHFLVNGYGNSWYLDQGPGEYKLKIQFSPQTRFYKGIIVSLVGTMILTLITIINYRRYHAKA